MQVRVSLAEALARGQYQPVVEAMVAAFRRGQTPYAEAFQLVEAASAEPQLLRPLMQQLLQSRPADSRTWRVMTLCHRYLHEWRQAVAALQQCHQLGDYDDHLRFTEANLRELLGEDEQVERLLRHPWREALRPRVWALRARLWLRRGDDHRLVTELRPWLQARAVESQPINREAIQACWKYLGQAQDHLGDHEAAFTAFTRGAPQDRVANEEHFIATLEAYRRVVTAQWFAGWSAMDTSQRTPAFLVGFPRSGTTLMEQGLDAHPDVIGLEERPTLSAAFEAFQRQVQKQSATLQDRVQSAVTLSDKLAIVFAAMASLDMPAVDSLRNHYWQAVNAFVELSDNALLLDKMPLNILHIPFILRLFPAARFIVALRDPADCVFSGFMQHFESNPAMQRLASLDSGAAFYAETMALFQQYRQVFELESQLHFVHYERLIDDWQGVMTGIFQFLDLDWHDAVSDFQRHAMARGNLATPSYQDVVRPLTRRAAGRWRKYEHLIGDTFAPLAPYRKLWGYD